ncbi:hypothetical protein ABNF17_13455, partial [Paenibacillus larvae]
GYEYGSFHFLEPSFLHNYTDSTFGVTTVDVNKQNENAKMFYYCHLKLTVNQRSFMGRDRLLHEAFLITGG